MKRIFLALIFLLFVNSSFAQMDTIVLKNGQRRPVTIIALTKKEVSFRDPANAGHVFTVARKDIGRLVVSSNPNLDQMRADSIAMMENKYPYSRIAVYTDLMQPLLGHLQFGLCYTGKNGKAGISAAITINVRDETKQGNYKTLETQINKGFLQKSYGSFKFNLYPSGQKRLSYYAALGMDVGTAYYSEYSFALNRYKINEVRYLGMELDNGFIFHPVHHLFCKGFISLGVSKYSVETGQKNDQLDIVPKVLLGFLIGYGF